MWTSVRSLIRSFILIQNRKFTKKKRKAKSCRWRRIKSQLVKRFWRMQKKSRKRKMNVKMNARNMCARCQIQTDLAFAIIFLFFGFIRAHSSNRIMIRRCSASLTLSSYRRRSCQTYGKTNVCHQIINDLTHQTRKPFTLHTQPKKGTKIIWKQLNVFLLCIFLDLCSLEPSVSFSTLTENVRKTHWRNEKSQRTNIPMFALVVNLHVCVEINWLNYTFNCNEWLFCWISFHLFVRAVAVSSFELKKKKNHRSTNVNINVASRR